MFPSSQSSVEILNPFPQERVHVSDEEGVPPPQVYPASVSQAELHPSPSTIFPSSQNVAGFLVPEIVPTPQIFVHVSIEEADPPLQI